MFGAIFAVVFLMLLVPVEAEAVASVRYLNVEAITYESIVYQQVPTDATHFVYTFGMWKVNAWSDRVYYVAYVVRDSVPVVVAKWSVGFSVTGGLQGIYLDYSTDLIEVHTVMAEFPYTTQVLVNPIDGEQAYRFYRMHFYFRGELFKGETVTIAADYMQQPFVEGLSKQSILSAQNAQSKQSKQVLDESTTGDSASYRIIKTNPSNFKFKEVHVK